MSRYFIQDVNLVSWDGEALLHIAARWMDVKHPDQPVSDILLNDLVKIYR